LNPPYGARIGLDMPKQPIQKGVTFQDDNQRIDDPQTLDPNEAAVAKLAYELWLQRGSPEGSPEHDWFSAKSLLQASEPVAVRSILSSTLPEVSRR